MILDTASPRFLAAAVRRECAERARNRAHLHALAFQAEARSVGREAELRGAIDAAWAELGLAAAEAEAAAVELERVRRLG